MLTPVKNLNVRRIERFVVDVSSQQNFYDGLSFGEEYICPQIQDFLADKNEIVVLIPEGTPFYKPQQKNTTVMAEFFVGALEPLLQACRNHLFASLTHEANRDKIRFVGGSEHQDAPLDDVLRDVFKTAWDTYAPLEQYFLKRFSIGIRMNDGRDILARWTEDRMLIEDEIDEKISLQLGGWGNKFFKGLDNMFMSNLQLSDRIISEDLSYHGAFIPSHAI